MYVFESVFKTKNKVENLFGSKFTEGYGFGFSCGNIEEPLT